MTGHLTKIQSPINKSYFETIEYVKVPGFWSGITNVHQLQHALASISDKVISQDWAGIDQRDFNQDFDMSLLYSSEDPRGKRQLRTGMQLWWPLAFHERSHVGGMLANMGI